MVFLIRFFYMIPKLTIRAMQVSHSGHEGVEGNEKADLLAKAGASMSLVGPSHQLYLLDTRN